jgi:hypothetical protein
MWTGVRLHELLDMAGVKSGALQVQFQGLDIGQGPKGLGSGLFLKSLELGDPVLEECVVAYLMNDEPLPMLNGFPVRLVVPGYFATYWVKSLTWIRVLNEADENFWMKTGYRVPDTPRGNTTPEDVKAGRVKMVPIERLPVRSFLISPDGGSKIPMGMNIKLRGIAFKWIWPGEPRGSFRGWGKNVACCATRGRPRGILLPQLGSVVDSEVAGTSHTGGACHRRKREHPT